jgi:hypothetical protein
MYRPSHLSSCSGFLKDVEQGKPDSSSLIQGYCYSLYQKTGTFGEVAKITRLDRRTVKKYILAWEKNLLLDRPVS